MKIRVKQDNTRHEGHLANFISWRRLFEESLRQTGEIHDDEEVTHIEVVEEGITYFVAKRAK